MVTAEGNGFDLALEQPGNGRGDLFSCTGAGFDIQKIQFAASESI